MEKRDLNYIASIKALVIARAKVKGQLKYTANKRPDRLSVLRKELERTETGLQQYLPYEVAAVKEVSKPIVDFDQVKDVLLRGRQIYIDTRQEASKNLGPTAAARNWFVEFVHSLLKVFAVDLAVGNAVFSDERDNDDAMDDLIYYVLGQEKKTTTITESEIYDELQKQKTLRP